MIKKEKDKMVENTNNVKSVLDVTVETVLTFSAEAEEAE